MWKLFLSKFKKRWFRSEGSALVITLLILLALMLLGLAIMLQSNTEYMISINERDATAALYNGEAALELSDRKLRDFISSGNTDFSQILKGYDDIEDNFDDGIIRLRNYQAGVTRIQLNDDCSGGSTTCESDVSVIEQHNGVYYEVFRIGMDRDGSVPAGKSGWDGPRGLLYVRIDDNHDDAPNLDDVLKDVDKRVVVTAISRYPIFVDASGLEVTARSVTNRTVGVAERKLIARYGPSFTRPAMATDGDMEISGSLDVCGECGAVHANQTLTVGSDDVDTCSDATASAGAPSVDPSAQIGGVADRREPIEIPISNPYHEDYVPSTALFDTSGDTTLSAYPQLQCPAWDEATNPGGTKYFSLVGDNTKGKVFKAYWDNTNSVWTWKLIDILGDGANTVLDDCGRVVSYGSPSDPNLSGAVADTNAGTGGHAAIDDGSDNHFYDFNFSDPGGPAVTCVASDDDTLSGVAENDFGAVSSFTGFSYMLPGTGGLAPATADGNADFLPADCMKKSENKWLINGDDVWSPLYNAVIFVYGNLSIVGGPSTLCYSADTPPCTTGLPGGVWRATFLSFNNLNGGGTPAYAPARSDVYAPDYQFLLISGRDLELGGNTGGGDVCPVACTDPSINLAGYSGIMYAHEQIDISGNVGINGIVKSEDAATCSTYTVGPGLQASGSAQVYYDCIHPPTPVSEGLTVTSWEEIQ